MDKLAEKLAGVLGSAWMIGGFGLWVVVHAVLIRDYVATISDLAIEIGFLILRAENSQSTRTEQAVKRDLKKSDTLIKLVKEK